MKERNNFKRKALFHVTKVLWHLDIFRRSFRELSGHACMADSCIFCALKDLFGQLQFSHERALPPDALRKALAQSFSDQHRFQLGFMDDAAECFENILLRIHFHIAYNEAEDMCNAKHCIPHQKFAMTLVEQSVCGVCHATSEPLPFTQMVHYVSASALISQAKQFNGASHPDLFGQLLKKAGGMGDIRDCPSSCGAKIQIRRTLINRPEIVSVGIVWDSDRPSLEHIMSLLDTLRIHLRLSDVFHGSFDSHHGESTYHQLVGVVTYYGKHYSTFFFHTKLRVWVYFDDANVREVGPHWEHVVEKCRRGRYQPLLLLFATPTGSPVDASHAPKSITLVDKPNVILRGTGGGGGSHHDVTGKPPIQRSSLSPTGSLAMGGRRSLTPSPEKPPLNNELTQRRAVTPNPDQSAGQVNGKPVLPNNDYQNLVQFQDVIFNRGNGCDGQTAGKQDPLEKHIHPMRKELVRRDSGNWSGDRNSASSSSSTSLENPYHYILGKMNLRGYGGIPRSPNKNGDLSSGSGNSSGGPADPGYDSFSLSSTDSIPIQQNLKYNFQLAQIPEGHQTPNGSNHMIDENSRVADDCERLCAEVDQLLDRSEQAEDLITALSLCNAAVNKARAAMDAPYSNPQTASFATMKHNACVLRARSLHRKLEEPLHNNLKYGEARHSREGSGCSGRGSSGSHSRQNSKDKGNHSHSRQNSQELLNIQAATATPLSPNNSTTLPQPLKASPDPKSTSVVGGGKLSPSKNIEIYATLPKSKKGLLSRSSPKSKNVVVEDEEYFMKERPGRSLLGNRSKQASKKEIEKRARSEERNTKSLKDVAPAVVLSSKDKEREQKEQKKLAKQEEKQNKKQHKIRRKLLMGGLMRRKNRSMPDLRDDITGETVVADAPKVTAVIKEVSKDDSMVNSKTAIQSNLSGYLSEGNLEYAGNPNLERSKLMRKSFHGSKLLPFNKVPPPPPLRTTSQLSKTEETSRNSSCSSTVTPSENKVVYANNQSWCQGPTSLPFILRNYDEKSPKTDAITYSKGGYLLQQPAIHTVVTEAQIHHEASFQSLPPSIDEPDFVVNKVEDLNFQLPPYPSPIHSTVHSRQASEDFPPPPPTTAAHIEQDSSFLSMLQEKCEKLMDAGYVESKKSITGGENWLRELQAKQAERKRGIEPLPPAAAPGSTAESNVKDLKSKFEQMQATDEVDYVSKLSTGQNKDMSRGLPSVFHRQERCDSYSNLKIATHSDVEDSKNVDQKRKSGKKKNVTFCEQVVLVATADDDEADSYIPNPILERVLRTVLHKESTNESKEHAVHSMVPLKRSDSWRLSKGLPLKPYPDGGEDVVDAPLPSCTPVLPKEPIKSCLPNSNHSKYSTTSSEPVDEVDAPSQTLHEKQQQARQSLVYTNSQAYSPTYIPASSHCGPASIKNEYRDEYPEPASLQPDQLQNGYSDVCNNSGNNGGAVHNQLRKFDSYSNAENTPVRYSPICNPADAASAPTHNGFHSGYGTYQSNSSAYQPSSSPSYQPMSLQYYPSSSQNRSSPQIGGYREQSMKMALPSNSHYPASLTRQNSNVCHYNKQLPPTDPRKITTPASVSSSSRLSDSPRSQYHNMVPQQQQYNHHQQQQQFNHQQQQFNQQQQQYSHQQQYNQLYNNYQQQYSQQQQQQYGQQQQTQYGQQQRLPNNVGGSYAYGNELSPKSIGQSNPSPSSSGHQLPAQHMPTSSTHYSPSLSSGHPNGPHQPSSSSSSTSSLHQSYSSSSPQYSIAAHQPYSPNSNHFESVHPSSLQQQQQHPPQQQQQHHVPSHLPPNTNNSMHQISSTNGCDSLPRNSSTVGHSPYQSIPHNANSYEMHCSRNGSVSSNNSTSSSSSTPYQHVPFGGSGVVNVASSQSKVPQQHRTSLPPVYQHPPPPPVNPKSSTTSSSAVYQRVPTSSSQPQMRSPAAEYNGCAPVPAKYSPYQHPPMPKPQPMDTKKSNGTAASGAVVPCNLCRKKQISPPSVYCTDCDFYISRFKQKG